MAETITDVVGGVDTHGDIHVAAVVDTCGRVLDTASFAATATGYRRLLAWMRRKGVVVRIGVEGTGPRASPTPSTPRLRLGPRSVARPAARLRPAPAPSRPYGP